MFLVATVEENNVDDLNEILGDIMDWIGQNQVFSYGDFPLAACAIYQIRKGKLTRPWVLPSNRYFSPESFL